MLVNWFHYQPPSASRVLGSDLNWSFHLSRWIANPQTSPGRRFSREGSSLPPPRPGHGCGGDGPGCLDIFLSHEWGRGRAAGFPPDGATSLWPLEPCGRHLVRFPNLRSVAASAFILFILWRLARDLAHSAQVLIGHIHLVPTSTLLWPKRRAQQPL